MIDNNLCDSAHANLWCYSCVSSQPGCEEYSVNWLIHHAITCPREDDKCVKIIERRGGECSKFYRLDLFAAQGVPFNYFRNTSSPLCPLADVQVTRDCLSNLIGFRKDIPSDHYEGCRAAGSHPKVAVYVENSVKELDLRR